ncbi:MAG: hypothetical protein K2W85_11660 [Phycisphaerales bacterium]|nr:hypothetical protein [Phycisphaerales bacterium]
MSRLLTRVASLSIGMVLAGSAALAQPVNDLCTSATFISMPSGGSYTRTGSTASATSDLSESGCSDQDANDVWFRFIAPTTGSYSFDLFLGTNFDTTLSVWQGDCALFSPGTALACNDDEDLDFGILTSWIPGVNISAGTEIRVRISGFQNDFGNYQITIIGPTGASVTGACCSGTTCTVQAAGTCSATFIGVGATCSPSPCAPPPAGICCRGASCSTTVAQANCTAIGGAGAVWVSSSATCNSGSDTTPCCYSDFNKTGGTTVADIFDYLNEWFASAPAARYGGDGTGTPVVADLFAYLNAWFVGGC